MNTSDTSNRYSYRVSRIPRISRVGSETLVYHFVGILIFFSVAFPELQIRIKGFPFDPLDLGWAVIFFHLILTNKSNKTIRSRIPFRTLYWVFLLLHFPGGILSSILSLTSEKALYWTFRYLVAASTFFTIATLTRDSRDMLRWATYLLFGILFQSFIGVGQVLLPDNPIIGLVNYLSAFSREAFHTIHDNVGGVVIVIFDRGSYIYGIRASGTMWNAIGYCELLVVGYSLAAGILLYYGEPRHRTLVYVAFPFLFLGILFSGSRVGYIALVVIAFYIFIKTRNARYILPLIVVIILFNVFSSEYYDYRVISLSDLGEVSEEFSHRFGLERWETWWFYYFFNQPVQGFLGSGFGANQTGYIDIDSGLAAAGMHNLYARLAAKIGLVGALVFLLLVYKFWRRLGQLFKNTMQKKERMPIIGAQSAIIIFLLIGVSDHYMISIVGGWRYIWILFGIIAALITIYQQEEVNA